MKRSTFRLIRWVAEMYLEIRFNHVVELAARCQSYEERSQYNRTADRCQDLINDIHNQRAQEKYNRILKRVK